MPWLTPRRLPRPVRPRLRLEVENLEARLVLDATLDGALLAALTPAVRSIDGSGNNLLNYSWGSSGQDLLRTAPAQYADGASALAGPTRPSPRLVSITIATDSTDGQLNNNRNMSDWVYAWGQFIDHDLDLTSTGIGAQQQSADIPVPQGDPYFDPEFTGTQVIAFDRSEYDPATGTGPGNPRQQINDITAWLDGSQIYGDDPTRADALRTHVDGLLLTSPGDLLPFNTAGLPNENQGPFPDNQLFLGGDVRANENIELTAVQTVFVREHNRVAGLIHAADPSLSDEAIYQTARAVVIGEEQVITYNEFLPALLGTNALTRYTGYNPAVNPGIANEFSTAAYRFGHSLVAPDVQFLNNDGSAADPTVSLANSFFNPALITQNGVDPILKYLASDNTQEVDNKIVPELQDFLFGPPGSGGFDLAALNIQRGRDHGLADYNTTRAAYGLPRVTSFAQISSDPDIQAALQKLYGNVDNIDLWVGGLAEDHMPGGSVGPLFERIIADQFERVRDSDRFWYQQEFSGPVLAAIESTTLADVIRNNSSITNLPDNVFFFTPGTVAGHIVQSADSLGVGGVRVVAEDGNGNVLAATRTSADGSFSLTGLPTGASYQVRVVPPPGSIVATAVVQSVRLVAADTAGAFGVDFSLSSSVPSRIGVVRAGGDGSAVFSLDNNGDGTFDSGDQAFELGQATDQVLVGDWDGQGYDTVGTVRPDGQSTLRFELDMTGQGIEARAAVYTFGAAGDQVVVGDWNGDGRTKIGVARPAPDGSGALMFTLDTNGDGKFDAGDQVFEFGFVGDQVLVGDWTGDGRSKVGVVRPDGLGSLNWSLDTSGTGRAFKILWHFGAAGDHILIGDWHGGGADQIGVVRSAADGIDAAWSLDTNGDGVFDASDQAFAYGLGADTFLVGDWTARGSYQAGSVRPDGQGDLAWSPDISGTGHFGAQDPVFTFGHTGDFPILGRWRP